MKRIDLPEPQVDARLDAVIVWLQGTPGARWLQIESASTDASFRRYFRLTDDAGQCAIVMDAPPLLEDVLPFVNVLNLLAAGGIHVPILKAADTERGFLLLSDLGRSTYLQTLLALHASDATDAQRVGVQNALYSDAINTLVTIQKISPHTAAIAIPPYDASLLRRELELFPDWFLQKHTRIELTNDEKNALERCFALLIASALAQPTVLVHGDYMPRNLMTMVDRNPGVIDFQDAVVGPISYDIACLMRDAFVSWEEPQIIDWTVNYWERARVAGLPVRGDFSEFYREFEWMGLQRHLKVLGIFARINYRDGKPKYLADSPRFVRYVRHAAKRYSAFTPLLRLFDRIEGAAAPEVGYTF
jgi:N-acetylmuramate 1-kinase